MAEERLCYDVRSAHPTWFAWVVPGAVVLAILNFGLNLARGVPERSSVVLVLTALAVAARWLVRRRAQEVVVDATGVRMPVRGSMSWEEIRAIRAPGPYVAGVVLVRRDGTEVPTPLPAEYAEQVARIGGVPLE